MRLSIDCLELRNKETEIGDHKSIEQRQKFSWDD